MKKLLFLLAIIISIIFIDSTFAGRGCCSHHGGQAYCGSNGMWQCNDGTESPSCGCGYVQSTTNYYIPKVTIPTCLYGEQLIGGICVSNNIACTKKYPGTTYDILSDKCICENGAEFDNKQKKCINKIQQCNTKFPGTTYQADGDKCVCRNGGEYDSKKKSCIDALADKCKYSGGEKARVGDISAQGTICGINGEWSCKTGTEWDSNLSKCISTGDKVCKSVYGDKSVWTKKVENKKYICGCVSGYDMVGDKCVIAPVVQTTYSTYTNPVTTTSNPLNQSSSSNGSSIREQRCNINEYYSSSYDKCFCNLDYSKYNGVCTSDKEIERLTCGPNEYYSSSYDKCFCNLDYSKYNGVCTLDN